MKPSLFAMSCSIAAVLSVTGIANAADTSLAAIPASNFAFCLNTNASIIVSDSVASEVGVVVTNIGNSITNTKGSVVVAANNFYGNGAGGEWKSGMGQFDLTVGGTGNCFSVATMNKTTSPNGQIAWTCAATSGAASGAGATITGVISTQTQITPIATGYVLAGVSSTLSNAPLVNCPY